MSFSAVILAISSGVNCSLCSSSANTADKYYVYQPSLTRLEANYLLGKLDKTIATFFLFYLYLNYTH